MKWIDLEYFIILMEINMKVNGKIIKEKDLEFFILQKGGNMKENGKVMK